MHARTEPELARNMPHSQLDNLVRIGQLEAEPTAESEIAGLMRFGLSRLADVERTDPISPCGLRPPTCKNEPWGVRMREPLPFIRAEEADQPPEGKIL